MRSSEMGILVGADVSSMEDVEQGVNIGGPQCDPPTSARRSTEYLDRKVTPKLDERPWLDILTQFLDPDESNFAIAQEQRLTYFNIKVVSISATGAVSSPISCEAENDFHDAIKADNERYGTVIFAENISCAMIDAIGTTFDIEPEFFAYYLTGIESNRMGSWQPDMPVIRTPHALSQYLRKAPFYSLYFRRPSHVEGGFKAVRHLRRTATNIPRGGQFVTEDLPDVFIAEKISVYKRKGSNFSESPWRRLLPQQETNLFRHAAIILTDKPLTRDLPASYMRDIITLPDEDSDNVPSSFGMSRLSAQEELLSWFRRLKPDDAKTLFDDQKPIALRPILKIVEKSSAMFVTHVWAVMTRIHYGHTDKKFPNNIPFFLRVSRNLEIQLHDELKILAKASRLAAFRGGELVAEEIQDFKHLMEDMAGALRALEEDVRFIVFASSMNDGKMVGWITKFAYLFLPLSLLAAVLAIPGGDIRFPILAALGIPFVLASTWLMFYWKPSEIDTLRFENPHVDR